MLDKVCSRTKFHPKCFDAKVSIFRVGLVSWTDFKRLHLRIAIRISKCVFNFWISFQSQTFIVDEEGIRPCITAVLQDHVLLTKFLTTFPLSIHNSFLHETVFEADRTNP